MFGRIIRAIGRFFRKIGEKLSSFGNKKAAKAEPKIKKPKIDKSNVKKSSKVKSKPEPLNLPSDSIEDLLNIIEDAKLDREFYIEKTGKAVIDFDKFIEELTYKVEARIITDISLLQDELYSGLRDIRIMYNL